MEKNGCGFLIGLVFIATFFQMMASSCSSNNNNFSVPTNTDSFEYRYAKERVKLEGYSDKEASQAAEAIIKFNNAQKNR